MSDVPEELLCVTVTWEGRPYPWRVLLELQRQVRANEVQDVFTSLDGEMAGEAVDESVGPTGDIEARGCAMTHPAVQRWGER